MKMMCVSTVVKVVHTVTSEKTGIKERKRGEIYVRVESQFCDSDSVSVFFFLITIEVVYTAFGSQKARTK